eukprot:scaffold143733_cov157-Phaeocystis_antarctica.AAC.1
MARVMAPMPLRSARASAPCCAASTRTRRASCLRLSAVPDQHCPAATPPTSTPEKCSQGQVQRHGAAPQRHAPWGRTLCKSAARSGQLARRPPARQPRGRRHPAANHRRTARASAAGPPRHRMHRCARTARQRHKRPAIPSPPRSLAALDRCARI